MDVALRVAERVTMMHDGRVIVEGTPDEIRANELVHDLYLGGGPSDAVDVRPHDDAARGRGPERVLRQRPRAPGRELHQEPASRSSAGTGWARRRSAPRSWASRRRAEGSMRFAGKELVGGRRTRSRSSASATSRRDAGCSRRSRWTSTCGCPARGGSQTRLDDRRRLRAVPAPRRAQAERRRAALRRRAADARDRARARHEPAPDQWTSRPRGLRRRSSRC